MKNRRQFIQHLAGAGMMGVLPYFQTAQGAELISSLKSKRFQSSDSLSTDEDFWRLIRQSYTVSSNIVNLNNGGVCPQPKVVQEAVERYHQLSNEAPSYYMWRVLDMGREPLRVKLASLAGCSPEEIAINRNSSEALETVIFGLRLQKGDEVVLAKQDYPNMINAWKQREQRDGIVLKWVNLELPSEDSNYLKKKYEEQFSAKTKLVHVTHLINWMGQIMPVKEIAEAAHKIGAEVLCDAAHSFAHLDYSIPELSCDYWGTSLHKWLCAPFGTGMLWVKKDKVSKLYPLFAAENPESEDIRKFENLGTRSFALEQAIGQAIDFHEMIGIERKFARLHFLKKYWAEKVAHLPGVSLGTSLDPKYSGAIALLKIEGKKPSKIANSLFNTDKIHTVGIEWENISGVRITPNVYTSLSDLNRLVSAITKCVKI